MRLGKWVKQLVWLSVVVVSLCGLQQSAMASLARTARPSSEAADFDVPGEHEQTGVETALMAQALFYEPNDPFESYNRHAFALNQTLDRIVLKPVAHIYNTVLPWPARQGVSNVFQNLGEVPTAANDVFQGNFSNAWVATWRFVINSTVGLLGLVDVASHLGLKHHYNDLGLTLAYWGDTHPPYLVLPFLGSSSLRDAFARPVSARFLNYYSFIQDSRLRTTLFFVNIVSIRASLLKAESIANAAALDPYIFQRDAYMQFRQELLRRNHPEMFQDAGEPYHNEKVSAKRSVMSGPLLPQ